MEHDLCWFSFFVWLRVGGRRCSNFLASTVRYRSIGVQNLGALLSGSSQRSGWGLEVRALVWYVVFHGYAKIPDQGPVLREVRG